MDRGIGRLVPGPLPAWGLFQLRGSYDHLGGSSHLISLA